MSNLGVVGLTRNQLVDGRKTPVNLATHDSTSKNLHVNCALNSQISVNTSCGWPSCVISISIWQCKQTIDLANLTSVELEKCCLGRGYVL